MNLGGSSVIVVIRPWSIKYIVNWSRFSMQRKCTMTQKQTVSTNDVINNTLSDDLLFNAKLFIVYTYIIHIIVVMKHKYYIHTL